MGPAGQSRRPGAALALVSRAWCCGSLQTGAISVASTNIVSVLLAFLWIVQDLAASAQPFIGVVVSCLVVFLLMVANVCLIYGAIKRKRHMVAPWLVVYAVAMIAIVVACGVKFDEMGKVRAVSVAALVFFAYFYVVVATFYAELRFDAAAAAAEEAVKVVTNGNGGAHCLITLGEGTNDDTFSDLAMRSHPTPSKLDSSAESSGPSANGLRNTLPQPDEVIAIPQAFSMEPQPSSNSEAPEICSKQTSKLEDECSSGEERDALLAEDQDDVDAASQKAAVRRSLSSKTLPLISAAEVKDTVESDVNGQPQETAGTSAKYQQQKSASSSRSALRHSNSALVGDIDSTFTPHKSGSASALSADMPKMRYLVTLFYFDLLEVMLWPILFCPPGYSCPQPRTTASPATTILPMTD